MCKLINLWKRENESNPVIRAAHGEHGEHGELEVILFLDS